MTKLFRYVDDFTPLPDGGGYIQSARRHRRRPLQTDKCPFCYLPFDSSARIEYFQWLGTMWATFANHNPIVAGQYLTVPLDCPSMRGAFPICRQGLRAGDVDLMLDLAAHGFASLPLLKVAGLDMSDRDREGPRFVWVNPLPGASRSVPHLHLNSIPCDSVPILEFVVGEPVTGGIGRATIRRVASRYFPALEVSGGTRDDLSLTVEHMHQWFNVNGVPYNLLCLPSNSSLRLPRLIIVPRSLELSPSIGQRLAGLEFLSGVVIPALAFWNSMNSAARADAFREATLDEAAFEELCETLNSGLQICARVAVVPVATR